MKDKIIDIINKLTKALKATSTQEEFWKIDYQKEIEELKKI